MATLGDDSGESSICCDPKNAPIIYQWFRYASGDELIDIFKSMLAKERLTDFDRDRFVGEFRARIGEAEKGRLYPLSQVKGPMRSETRFKLFEIKWDWEFGENKELHIRLYHVEPKELRHNRMVIGLHIHKKNVRRRIWFRQSFHIRKAGARYFKAKSANWGL